MDSASKHRRPRKIRRTGRHTTPSQVEKAAEKAGKAAPAMAIAGVLVAAPQAHTAVKSPGKAATVAEQVHTGAVVRHIRHSQHTSRSYDVRAGDTLYAIAQRFYGHGADWPWLYHVNESQVTDPNLIYVGEKLQVPYDPPANAASYAPKHAKTVTLSSSDTDSSGTDSAGTASAGTDSAGTDSAGMASSGTSSSGMASSGTSSSGASSSGTLRGTLGCSGLEVLWEAAGGSHGAAFMAAEIAMAESGGQQYAVSPTNDYGYWQINGSHGALATFNPIGNARAAIIISSNGTNWDPWTTYTSGAYQGRC